MEDWLRYSTRKRIIKISTVVGGLILFVVLNIIIFMTVARPKTPLEKRLVQLDVSAEAQIFPYADGILSVDKKLLTCYDIQGAVLFTVELKEANMQADRSGSNTVVWDNNNLYIYDENGIEQVSMEMPYTNEQDQILLARCGKRYFVISTIEEEQHKARVYDYDSQLVDEMLFPFQSMINLGFYGETGNQLWALLLDSHGTMPICKMRTDQPGKSMTGSISIMDQICYTVMPLANNVYTVGTHHIQSWTYTNVKQTEQLVYGWTLQDYRVSEERADFLMGPSDSGDTFTPLSSIWYIGQDKQFRLSMPAGILRAMMTESNIYAIANQGVYEYKISDSNAKRKFYKMPFYTDEVVSVVNGKAFVLRSDDILYYVPVE